MQAYYPRMCYIKDQCKNYIAVSPDPLPGHHSFPQTLSHRGFRSGSEITIHSQRFSLTCLLSCFSLSVSKASVACTITLDSSTASSLEVRGLICAGTKPVFWQVYQFLSRPNLNVIPGWTDSPFLISLQGIWSVVTVVGQHVRYVTLVLLQSQLVRSLVFL